MKGYTALSFISTIIDRALMADSVWGTYTFSVYMWFNFSSTVHVQFQPSDLLLFEKIKIQRELRSGKLRVMYNLLQLKGF